MMQINQSMIDGIICVLIADDCNLMRLKECEHKRKINHNIDFSIESNKIVIIRL